MIESSSPLQIRDEEEESSSMASTPRRKKKHPGSLPLSMFIHLDGQNANPECPNASNPYHKCADYCSEKGRERKDIHPRSVNVFRGGPEESNYLPKCKNASNPYHECSEYCSQNGTNYPSPSRLPPNEKHAESFFPRKVATEDESNEGTNRILNPDCIHASNPYHKCAEYCIRKKDTVKGGLLVTKSMEKRMDRNMAMKMKDPAEGVNRSKKGLKTVRWNVHPECRYASNPYHICVDKCFDLIREMGQGLEENKKGRKIVNMQPKSVSPSYQNSVEYSEEEGKDCLTICSEHWFQLSSKDGAKKDGSSF